MFYLIVIHTYNVFWWNLSPIPLLCFTLYPVPHCTPLSYTPLPFFLTSLSFSHQLCPLSAACLCVGEHDSLSASTVLLKKSNTPFSSSPWLLRASQLGWNCIGPSHSHGFGLAWSCTSLRRAFPAVVNSHVEACCQVRQILFGCGSLLPLVLTISSHSQWSLSPGRR